MGDVVFVYLERTLAPPEPLPPGPPPRAYGLAPAATADGEAVVAAVGSGEAVWLGFQAVDPERPAVVRVRVDRASVLEDGPPPIDAVTGERWDDALSETPRNHLVCPPDYCLPGVRGPAGHVPFVEGRLTVLVYDPAPAQVTVRLVDPDTFARDTGTRPEPIDPDSGYKGWRLP